MQDLHLGLQELRQECRSTSGRIFTAVDGLNTRLTKVMYVSLAHLKCLPGRAPCCSVHVPTITKLGSWRALFPCSHLLTAVNSFLQLEGRQQVSHADEGLIQARRPSAIAAQPHSPPAPEAGSSIDMHQLEEQFADLAASLAEDRPQQVYNIAIVVCQTLQAESELPRIAACLLSHVLLVAIVATSSWQAWNILQTRDQGVCHACFC